MAKEKRPTGKSRRKFLKDIGTGVIGTYVVSPNLKLKGNPIKKRIVDAYQGMVEISLVINKKNVKCTINPNTTLAELLRDELHLTGTKIVCNHGECGSCTVLLNNEPVYSCHILALDAANKEVLTIEGLLNEEKLNSIQKSFIENDGLQCGFCTPGQIMSAYSLLQKNHNPSDEEILNGMSGNLCRCGAYPKIFDSVKQAIQE